jgi:hypothetical protein
VRRSIHYRLLAFVVALLGGLPVPAFALTHGLVHAHLAHEHAGEPAHDISAVAFEEHSSDDHAHGHQAVDVAMGTRHIGRLDLPTVDVSLLPETAVALEAVVVAHAPALSDRALLARPDPGGGGPPPALRAPPIG